MDEAGWSATRFLETLQDAQTELRQVCDHYAQLGAQPQQPRVELSERPLKVAVGGMQRTYAGSVTLGAVVVGSDGREYDLVVETRWDDCSWTIATRIWIKSGADGAKLLRELPERSTGSLGVLREQVISASGDLRSFSDLITAPGER